MWPAKRHDFGRVLLGPFPRAVMYRSFEGLNHIWTRTGIPVLSRPGTHYCAHFRDNEEGLPMSEVPRNSSAAARYVKRRFLRGMMLCFVAAAKERVLAALKAAFVP